MDPSTVAELINDYFANIKEKNIAKKIPRATIDSSNSATVKQKKLANVKKKKLAFLLPATPNEASSVIDSRNNKKALRVNDVETKLIKFAKTIISPILSNLFKACITEGLYPTCLKVAEVIPIYKRGDTSNASNYRPISLLSQFDKIFEKLL